MDDATFSEEDIRQRFRFRRENILFLANLLRDDLMRPQKKSRPICRDTSSNVFEIFSYWKFSTGNRRCG